MAAIIFEGRILGQVVDHYIETRRNRNWPLSMAGAVKTIRSVIRCPEMTDAELGNVVAGAAVAKGCNVAFDIAESVAAERRPVAGHSAL